MKKLLQTMMISLAVLSVAACKHSVKESEAISESPPAISANKIVKKVYTDNFGDQMEVTVNETRNTVAIRLNGKSYELKKNEDLPEYTASSPEYQYSDIRGNITFLKKNVDMVLFHSKSNGKEKAAAKMASY
ncbi:hypothetical protein HNP38_003153 [Chryseobacterium defluvii]|uniref:Multicopper oxidase n=1 Tax=Chryseobacterium defluvii TaxID=160396 RepID=A0A840KIT1_9FLAO|nr:hypothetical protein [Chryseobacterium defluvii]MBB4807837.1 hypothetical protein [Chryseobacterium defluvii]